MVWALARREPKKAYSLLDLQPAKKIGNTLKPEIIIKIKRLYLYMIYLNFICITNQNKKARDKVAGPIIKNKDLFLEEGYNNSFENNFTASAKGCKMPKYPTLLGPLRNCLKDKYLRSSKVKKATLKRPRRRQIK